ETVKQWLRKKNGPALRSNAGPVQAKGFVLVLAAAGGDLDLTLVRENDRADEAERFAVSGREVRDRDRVAGLHGIRTARTEAQVRERVRGARRHDPVGRRAVGVLDVEIHRAVRIRERDFRQHPRHLAVATDIVDAGERVVSLQRAAREQRATHDQRPQSPLKHVVSPLKVESSPDAIHSQLRGNASTVRGAYQCKGTGSNGLETYLGWPKNTPACLPVGVYDSAGDPDQPRPDRDHFDAFEQQGPLGEPEANPPVRTNRILQRCESLVGDGTQRTFK